MFIRGREREKERKKEREREGERERERNGEGREEIIRQIKSFQSFICPSNFSLDVQTFLWKRIIRCVEEREEEVKLLQGYHGLLVPGKVCLFLLASSNKLALRFDCRCGWVSCA